MRAHNQQVTAGTAAVRIVACPLPVKSPWLNPIEPKWVHGKRRIVEPAAPADGRGTGGPRLRRLGCPRDDISHPQGGRLILH